MSHYRVSFFKDLLNSNGHSFKCLQREIDVESDGPSGALALAQQLTHSKHLDPDCVEVMRLAEHHHPEYTDGNPPPPCKQTWNRAP